MQDEGGAKKMNPVLERHWEKLVLGVVAALAVVYLGTRFSGPGDAAAKSVDRAAASFQAKKNQLNTRSEAPKAIPEHLVPPPGAANKAPEFAVGFKTEKEYIVVNAPTAAPAKFLFPNVTLGAADARPDGVHLSWTVGEVIIDPPDKTKIAVPRPTFVWKLERRNKGGEWGKWEKELKSEIVKYQDATVEPKTEYEYRITLGSNDPQYGKVNPKMWTEKTAGPVSTKTLGIWFFDFSMMLAFPDSDEPKPGQVYVTIQKYDKEAGLVEWKKIQYEGDFLGVIKDGGVEVSKHRVVSKKLGGKTVTVDFRSSAQIKKIITDKTVLYEYEECKVKIDDAGERKCDGPEKKKGQYKVDEVLYTDEDGKPQTFTKTSGPGPNAGYHCEKHGGEAPPKELTAEEKAAAHAKEAEAMLEEAERLWNKGTPADQKKAQNLYKTLIDRFKDVEAVKARLKDLTARVKKEIK